MALVGLTGAGVTRGPHFPACLLDDKDGFGGRVPNELETAGWGTVTDWRRSPVKNAWMRLTTTAACELHDTDLLCMLPAEGSALGRPCRGDEGGYVGAVSEADGRAYLHGIVSQVHITLCSIHQIVALVFLSALIVR